MSDSNVINERLVQIEVSDFIYERLNEIMGEKELSTLNEAVMLVLCSVD